MAAKRTAGDGGLSEKVGYYTDSDGQRIKYPYWQASRDSMSLGTPVVSTAAKAVVDGGTSLLAGPLTRCPRWPSRWGRVHHGQECAIGSGKRIHRMPGATSVAAPSAGASGKGW